MKTTPNKTLQSVLSGLVLTGLMVVMPMAAQAESLFRLGATYQQSGGYTPSSLYTPPSPAQVGDMITIRVNETATLRSQAELKLNREQTITENGTTVMNGVIGFMLSKLPFGTRDAENAMMLPTFNGIQNQNQLGSRAESLRVNTITDSITCQVVQVLPNGHLVVQGQKTLGINKERQNMVVTGIVNPYYLTLNNEINSNMVANFQLEQGGKGVISRQQNDGFANKIYQFFN